MVLLPIKENLEDNIDFIDHPDCQDTLEMSVKFFKNIGYHFPWVGYYAQKDRVLIGTGAFKGRPLFGKIEIAYGIFPQYRRMGYGTEICGRLLEIATRTDPSVLITARTLPAENFSTKILRKNNFHFSGTVIDPDDGEVWEWEYRK
ncbi:GNAT family N-acetyltransferase [Pseudochryseolinea flava]|uniref:N-acetyltransferase n=1 Tax=Pseudochryseolinea flava TaxID=2059302 RepID=A0A364XYV2_9BACT|nr:GNAT family N-acetyltransferase [Pseudochryseolinea flava]RAV99460.1 N-acetyltransferase [Pseudochryseolinea flava]